MSPPAPRTELLCVVELTGGTIRFRNTQGPVTHPAGKNRQEVPKSFQYLRSTELLLLYPQIKLVHIHNGVIILSTVSSQIANQFLSLL